MFTNEGINILEFSFSVLSVVALSLLLENQVAVRIILLLEIGLATVVGFAVAATSYVGSSSFVVAVVILVVAAVESILLLGFVILLYRLSSIMELIRLQSLQF